MSTTAAAPRTFAGHRLPHLSLLACEYVDRWRWIKWTPLGYANRAEAIAAGEIPAETPSPLEGARVLVFPPEALRQLELGNAEEATTDDPQDPQAELYVLPYAENDGLAHRLLRTRAPWYTDHSQPDNVHVVCSTDVSGQVGVATGPAELYAAVVTLAVLRAHRVIAR